MTAAQRRARQVGRSYTSAAYIRWLDRKAGGLPTAGSGNAGGNQP